ncbi:hypothetical protein [Butyrivibrio sp. WCD3002]|nr:hypothetical protein [Butyrivibrio sp. WCD3002]
MRKVVSKLDEMLIGMKVRLAQKKPAVAFAIAIIVAHSKVLLS